MPPRLATLLVVLLVSGAASGQAQNTPWDSVGHLLGARQAPVTAYHRYNLPRRDLTLKIGDVTVAPALALGAWAGFSGEPGDATMMGDLVLIAPEVRPVQAELARQGIEVTAVHNHLLGEEPRLTYLHFHGQGAAIDLAARLNRALALTATPRPVAAGAPQPVSIDTAAVFKALGRSGSAQGAVAQVSFILVPGTVTMDGRTVTPALGYGSPVNVQMVSPTRTVATGDFAVLGEKVNPMLQALASHGITATAVHSHMVGEAPHIYFIHFWADGGMGDVLAGLKAALDAAR